MLKREDLEQLQTAAEVVERVAADLGAEQHRLAADASGVATKLDVLVKELIVEDLQEIRSGLERSNDP